tara:strand:+ start:1643 stop:1915 length:273 start_codon:yes stop_codon:yes gene_type:complete
MEKRKLTDSLNGEFEPEDIDSILDNFDQFCDEFENAAAKRFAGRDNDSRTPITHSSVESVTPVVVREVEPLGAEDLIAGESPIDVQASEL